MIEIQKHRLENLSLLTFSYFSNVNYYDHLRIISRDTAKSDGYFSAIHLRA